MPGAPVIYFCQLQQYLLAGLPLLLVVCVLEDLVQQSVQQLAVALHCMKEKVEVINNGLTLAGVNHTIAHYDVWKSFTSNRHSARQHPCPEYISVGAYMPLKHLGWTRHSHQYQQCREKHLQLDL